MTQLNSRIFMVVLLVASVVMVLGGFTVLNAMLAGFRYQHDWWSSVTYWELLPGVKIDWWLSEVLALLLLATGCFQCGFCIDYLRRNLGVSVVEADSVTIKLASGEIQTLKRNEE